MRENEIYRRTDETIKQELLTGERALFRGLDLKIRDCIFDDGESPLKEGSDLLPPSLVVRGSTGRVPAGK